MKTLSNFFEDIEQRRQALAQRRADQLSSFKEKGAAASEKRQEVLSRQRERINDLNLNYFLALKVPLWKQCLIDSINAIPDTLELGNE